MSSTDAFRKIYTAASALRYDLCRPSGRMEDYYVQIQQRKKRDYL